MIFKKLKSLTNFPEFIINEEGISLFKNSLSTDNVFKEITSTIGKYSRAFKPGNPDPIVPAIYIYDHYGLVLNKSQYNDTLLGIEFHYFVYKNLNIKFAPTDIFNGELILFGKRNLHLLTESNTKDYFPNAEIEPGFYNGQLITKEHRIVFRYDDNSKIISINVEFIKNAKQY